MGLTEGMATGEVVRRENDERVVRGSFLEPINGNVQYTRRG